MRKCLGRSSTSLWLLQWCLNVRTSKFILVWSALRNSKIIIDVFYVWIALSSVLVCITSLKTRAAFSVHLPPPMSTKGQKGREEGKKGKLKPHICVSGSLRVDASDSPVIWSTPFVLCVFLQWPEAVAGCGNIKTIYQFQTPAWHTDVQMQVNVICIFITLCSLNIFFFLYLFHFGVSMVER